MYIIDGNNVAGKLKILGEEHFDRKLMELVQRWNLRKRVKAIVVFDGGEYMGDKRAIDQYTSVVYTPRDSFYRDADDKIVEIIRQSYLSPGEAILLVTEDNELKKRVAKEAEAANQPMEMISSSDFVKKLEFASEDEEPDLSDDEMDDITRDLMKEWT